MEVPPFGHVSGRRPEEKLGVTMLSEILASSTLMSPLTLDQRV